MPWSLRRLARSPQIDEPGDRRGRVVRVKRREDQVSGQRGLHGDLGGLQVPERMYKFVSTKLPQIKEREREAGTEGTEAGEQEAEAGTEGTEAGEQEAEAGTEGTEAAPENE